MSLLRFPSRAFDVPLPPVPIAGTGDFCITIDRKWVPYLLGAAGVLCAGGTWESDQERCIAEAMTLLAQLMDGDNCLTETIDNTGVEIEDCEMKLRMCGGKLQFCDCGTWTDIPSCDGDTGGGFTPTQPGGGTDQPQPGGGTANYCGALSGLQKYYLPTLLNTGDIVTFSMLDGAWNDGIEAAWHCPDGYLFIGGACFQTLIYNGGTDPLMGVMHMALVGEIGGTFYDVLNIDSTGAPQPFTVPAGVVNQPLIVQGNVDYGGTIYGEVTFCVEVTNNQTATFTHPFYLTTNPGGFLPLTDGGTFATWIAGTGWDGAQDTLGSCSGFPPDRALLWISRSMPSARFINTIRIIGSTSTDLGAGSGARQLYVDGSGSSLGIDSNVGPFDITLPVNAIVNTDFSILINSICVTAGATVTVETVIVAGDGIDPF